MIIFALSRKEMTRSEFDSQVLLLARKLYTVSYRLLRRQDEAEDAVQEVFLRLWNRREELDRYGNFEAVATSSVKNYCIDILRRRKLMISGDREAHAGIYDENPDPSVALELNEDLNILEKIISRLPEIYRNIITMREIDDLSYEEISEITGLNINTLRVNLSRARKMIRDEFKKYRYEYTGNTHSA